MSKKISFKRPSNDMSNHITNAVMLLVIIINTKMVFLYQLQRYQHTDSLIDFLLGMFLGLITPVMLVCALAVAARDHKN